MDCGPLSVPRNGKKIWEDKTTFGGTIKFQCDEHLGYELKGSKQRTCRGDGRWSGNQTTCRCKYLNHLYNDSQLVKIKNYVEDSKRLNTSPQKITALSINHFVHSATHFTHGP